jgi:hypothetical protein
MSELPEYVCHKRVRAAKIVPSLSDEERAVPTLFLEGGREWPTTVEWCVKHVPEVGGYLVFYADGYVSYSPAKAFEEGYTRV